jgi:hypothetical protein
VASNTVEHHWMASHPHVDGVVYVCGPQPGREQQQLEGHEVHRDEQQRPAVRQRLHPRNMLSDYGPCGRMWESSKVQQQTWTSVRKKNPSKLNPIGHSRGVP